MRKRPKDLKWTDLTTLMEGFGYEEKQGRGSRARFVHRETQAVLMIHTPHNPHVLLTGHIKSDIKHLKDHDHVPADF